MNIGRRDLTDVLNARSEHHIRLNQIIPTNSQFFSNNNVKNISRDTRESIKGNPNTKRLQIPRDVLKTPDKPRENEGIPRPLPACPISIRSYPEFSDPLNTNRSRIGPRTSTPMHIAPQPQYTGKAVVTHENLEHEMLDNEDKTIIPHELSKYFSAQITVTPQLHEHVFEVLDYPLQTTLPAAFKCGPTPAEYKTTLDELWPVLSGEKWGDYPEYAQIYSRTRDTALPNFLATRIRVPSRLNIEAWNKYLNNYHDPALLDMITYGFPANYSATFPPTPTYHNHREREDYSSYIQAYIQKEVDMGALLGPFIVPPFSPWSQCSPMMTRDKSTPGERRVIVDMSHPRGASVNSGIPRREYMGVPHTYSLPAVSSVGDEIRLAGSGTFLWSVDVSRAYRQLRTDPLSAPLFGIVFGDHFFVDIALPFGCRSSGAACVRVTKAICEIMRQEGFTVIVYVDDFIGIEDSYDAALKAFKRIIALCKELGFSLATNKCIPPTRNIIWLGFAISAEHMTLSIPTEKLQAVLAECQVWLSKRTTTRKGIQRLVGRLVHVSSCVKPGRKFISRILKALSTTHAGKPTAVDDELKKDVIWFRDYAAASNGVCIIPPVITETFNIECDSCLTGGGAFSPSHYYAEQYTPAYMTAIPTIHALEAANLVEAIYTLTADAPGGGVVHINTDNSAAAVSLETGKCTDPHLGMCARELWLIATLKNFTVRISHKPGKDLILADALSRAHMSPQARAIVSQQCKLLGLKRIRLKHDIGRFTKDL